MDATAEGIGGWKWSYQNLEDGLTLCQGNHMLAEILPLAESEKKLIPPEKVMTLLVTAPQLWDAANEFIKSLHVDDPMHPDQALNAKIYKMETFIRLGNMVAKAVGKTDWKDVLQS